MNKVWQLQWTVSRGKPEPQQLLLYTHHPLTNASHPSYVLSESPAPPYLAYPWQTQVSADSKPCPGSRAWPEKPGHCNKVINFKFMIKLSAGIPTCNKIQSHCPSRPLFLLSTDDLSTHCTESEPVRARLPFARPARTCTHITHHLALFLQFSSWPHLAVCSLSFRMPTPQ